MSSPCCFIPELPRSAERQASDIAPDLTISGVSLSYARQVSFLRRRNLARNRNLARRSSTNGDYDYEQDYDYETDYDDGSPHLV
jgi:hypothetical protein